MVAVLLDSTGAVLVGIGALIAGCGSALSGVAALRKCSEKYDTRKVQRETT